MFWAHNDGKDVLELRKKNLFVAELIGTSNFNWQGTIENEKQIKFLIKKISLPSLNIPFERLHGNQFVHYFHVGEVNWEPITVSFVDVLPDLYLEKEVPNWRKMFFSYLNNNLITSTNRTNMLDLATFCETIKITSYSTYINITRNKDLPNNNEADTRTEVQDSFYIFKPKITKIDFGSLDYTSDEANEISVTFLPEWCDYRDTYLEDEKVPSINQQLSNMQQTNAGDTLSNNRRRIGLTN
jgi:hypothetical protein